MKHSGFLIFLMLLTGAQLRADEIKMLYDFERPQLDSVFQAKTAYIKISMPNAPNGGRPGQPALPASGTFILLPPNSKVENITINGLGKTYLGANYLIEPVAEQFPLSSKPMSNVGTDPDPEIYNRNQVFPENRYEFISVQRFRGYQMLVLKLLPVEYNPVSGKVYYYDRLEITVNTVPDAGPSSMFRGRDRDLQVVSARVHNPKQLDFYTNQNKRLSSNYDLLIITTPELADAFLPLKQYHDTTGIATEIHTTDYIGSNDPDAVRSYIRERYIEDGIEYVLIGGDDDLIPAKDLYVKAYNSIIIADMPGDIYFACLDGTYNYDGDLYWGELGDGPDGGEIDLMADVYVGRAPASNFIEASRIVNKTIAFLSSNETCLEKVVLAGQAVGFGGVADYAGNSLDELIEGSDNHNYLTTGIPSDLYSIETLYDRDWPNHNWPDNEIISRINDGLHIINHYGHSYITNAMKLDLNQIQNELTNDDYFMVYSQGCLAGHFDGAECWAEEITVKTDHGAFAAIMNARYGYGGLGTTDGSSQRYNRGFWNAVFYPGEGWSELGRAHHRAKENNLYRINEGSMRWCYYELTLFGDPSIVLKRVRNIAFDFPSGVPEILEPGQDNVFRMEIRGVGDGMPVPGSGKIHYSLDGDEWQEGIIVEIEPDAYDAYLPALDCGSNVQFYLSAEELTDGRIYHPNPLYSFHATAAFRRQVIFEDDFETDKGWTNTGGLWARGTPSGQGGNYAAGPDPASGHSGDMVYGYNLNGNYEDNLSAKHLISPAINCSGIYHTHLTFWKWLGLETAPYDNAIISVSSDGENWATIWESTSEFYDVDWNFISINISAQADNQPEIYVRWTMGPTDESFTYCGWNIDDILIVGYDCPDFLCGDANSDQTINVGDAVFLISYVFSGGPAPNPLEAGDANCDGQVNVGDAVYLIAYVFSGGAEPCCP